MLHTPDLDLTRGMCFQGYMFLPWELTRVEGCKIQHTPLMYEYKHAGENSLLAPVDSLRQTVLWEERRLATWPRARFYKSPRSPRSKTGQRKRLDEMERSWARFLKQPVVWVYRCLGQVGASPGRRHR